MANTQNDEHLEALETLELNDEQKKKVKELVDAGIEYHRQIKTLREGLKDSVGDASKELKIKASDLNKVIRVAFKNEVRKIQGEVDRLETLLHAAGRF